MSNPEVSALLTSCLSNANEERIQAHENLAQFFLNSPVEYLSALAAALTDMSLHVNVRDFAVVMMRKALLPNSKDSKSELWANVNEDVKSAVRQVLMDRFENEPEAIIRRHAADCLGVVATLNGELWEDVLPVLFNTLKSDQHVYRESSLDILIRIAEFSVDNIVKHYEGLIPVIAERLSDESPDVRVAALKFTISIVTALMTENKADKISPLCSVIPVIFEGLSNACEQGEQELVEAYLKELSDSAALSLVFFKDNLKGIVDLMIQITTSEGAVEDSSRRMALVFITQLLDAGGMAIRGLDDFSQRMIPIAFRFLCLVEGDSDMEEWASNHDDMDTYSWENFGAGVSAIAHLSKSLGASVFFPLCWEMVQAFIQSDNWVNRHAALVALTEMECVRAFDDHLDDMSGLVFNVLRNGESHPRVLWAALHLMGQLCTQSKFARKNLPDLIDVVCTFAMSEHFRVSRAAGAVMVDMQESLTKEMIQPHLEQLLEAQSYLVSHDNVYLKERGLSALGYTASAAGKHFLPFYSNIMGVCMDILKSSASKEMRTLRGTCMEAIGQIGHAVGKETFQHDAEGVLNTLVEVQQNVASDDPNFSCFLTACSRICMCLGERFTPFLQFITPSLLEILQKEDAAFFDDDNSRAEQFISKEGYDVLRMHAVGSGERVIVMNTSLVEEKGLACNALYQFAMHCKQGFADYAQDTLELVTPLCHYDFGKIVRISAVSCVGVCLGSMTKKLLSEGRTSEADHAPIANYFEQKVLPSILQAFSVDQDKENHMLYCSALHEAITESLYYPPSIEAVQHLFVRAVQCIMESHTRRAELGQALQQHEVDATAEEEMAMLADEENEYLMFVAMIVRAVTEKVKDAVVPAMKTQMSVTIRGYQVNELTLYSLVTEMLDNEDGTRAMGLSVMATIVKCSQEYNAEIAHHVMKSALEGVQIDDETVLANAVDAIGVVGEKMSTEEFSQYVEASVTILLQLLESEPTHDEDGSLNECGENASSAIGKIIEQHSQIFDTAALMPAFLQHLPYTKDEEEAVIAHERLARFVQQGREDVFGENNAYLPHIVSVFATVQGIPKLCNAETTAVMGQLFEGLSSKVDPAQLKGIMEAAEENRAAILEEVDDEDYEEYEEYEQ